MSQKWAPIDQYICESDKCSWQVKYQYELSLWNQWLERRERTDIFRQLPLIRAKVRSSSSSSSSSAAAATETMRSPLLQIFAREFTSSNEQTSKQTNRLMLRTRRLRTNDCNCNCKSQGKAVRMSAVCSFEFASPSNWNHFISFSWNHLLPTTSSSNWLWKLVSGLAGSLVRWLAQSEEVCKDLSCLLRFN